MELDISWLLELDVLTDSDFLKEKPPKSVVKKLHKCAVCDLPVTSLYTDYNMYRITYPFVYEYIPDLLYEPQIGPTCAIAAVVATIRSLAKFAGGRSDNLDEVVDYPLIQRLYEQLGVQNLDNTTAAVGNMTIKRALMLIGSIPTLESAGRFYLTELSVSFESNKELRRLTQWERLKNSMEKGSRFIYHSRNHYNRIFGFREVYDLPTSNTLNETVEDESNSIVLDDDDGSSIDEVTVMKELFVPMSKIGNEDPIERPIVPSSWEEQFAKFEALELDPNYVAPSKRPATLGSKKTRVVNESTLNTEGLVTVHRQILMAKRGQRPQHWVEWDSVCEDIENHKVHTIIEIRLK